MKKELITADEYLTKIKPANNKQNIYLAPFYYDKTGTNDPEESFNRSVKYNILGTLNKSYKNCTKAVLWYDHPEKGPIAAVGEIKKYLGQNTHLQIWGTDKGNLSIYECYEVDWSSNPIEIRTLAPDFKISHKGRATYVDSKASFQIYNLIKNGIQFDFV